MKADPVPTLPTFTTTRLTLRPRTLADLDACVAMNLDPLVTQFIPGPWNDPVAHRAFIEARIRQSYPAGMGHWCVFTPAAFIGLVFLAPEGVQGFDIEIGWRFNRSAWGQGFATEAARPVLDHAFRTLGLSRVIADIDPANAGSAGVARKLGFLPTETVQHGDWTMTRYMVEVS